MLDRDTLLDVWALGLDERTRSGAQDQLGRGTVSNPHHGAGWRMDGREQQF